MHRPTMYVALTVTAVLTAPDEPRMRLTYHPALGVTYHAMSVDSTGLEGHVESGPPTEFVRTLYYSTTAMTDTSKVPWLTVSIDSMVEVRGGIPTGTLGGSRGGVFVWASGFDDRREITIDTSDLRVRRAHHLFDPSVLDGTVAFSPDSIRKGDSWKSRVVLRFVSLRDSLGTLRGTAKVKLKDLIVSGNDTTAILGIRYSLDGAESYSENVHQGARMYGFLDGEERYSLSRGVTRALQIKGKLTYEFDIGPGNRPTTSFDVAIHRTLLDDR